MSLLIGLPKHSGRSKNFLLQMEAAMCTLLIKES